MRDLLLGMALLIIAASLVSATAQEANITLHSTVSGDREQPRVMYIVPWQQPAAADFDYELHNSIADELFTPVDRAEFLRELAYRDMLDSRAAEAEEQTQTQTQTQQQTHSTEHLTEKE